MRKHIALRGRRGREILTVGRYGMVDTTWREPKYAITPDHMYVSLGSCVLFDFPASCIRCCVPSSAPFFLTLFLLLFLVPLDTPLHPGLQWLQPSFFGLSFPPRP